MEILKGTPWWVYLLFFYVIVIGILALKTRTVSLKRLFILPTVFLAWSLYALITKLNTPLDVSIWIITLVVGFSIGWKLYKGTRIKADKKHTLIQIQGNLLTLILILSIFSTRYLFGYLYATNPNAQKNALIFTLDLISSGLITGIFVGKAICLWRKWQQSDHTNLVNIP